MTSQSPEPDQGSTEASYTSSSSQKCHIRLFISVCIFVCLCRSAFVSLRVSPSPWLCHLFQDHLSLSVSLHVRLRVRLFISTSLSLLWLRHLFKTSSYSLLIFRAQVKYNAHLAATAATAVAAAGDAGDGCCCFCVCSWNRISTDRLRMLLFAEFQLRWQSSRSK